VIVTGIFFIWGLLGHGGGTLSNQGGTLIVDKDTGQAYVFCERGKHVCPEVNYASARLDLKSNSVNQQTVSQAALAKYPRGPLLGIPGLPPLPDASLLAKQPWSVCTQTAVGVAGQQTTTDLSVGLATGGSPLGTGALLTQAQGQDWLIWNDQRMAIQQDGISALDKSSSTTQPPVQVPLQWLDALPQGPAFVAPAIPNRNQTVNSPAGGSAQVGQVYQVTVAGGKQFYVLLRDGLAPISQTQAALLAFEPSQPTVAPLNPSQVTGHLSKSTVPANGLPASLPSVTSPASTAPLCVVYTSVGGSSALSAQVNVGGQMPSGGAATNTPGDVDQVALPPGAGALVGDAPGPGQSSGAVSYFLVASGRRYALSETEVIGFLGYSKSQAVLLPAGVVDLIPQGPALNPAQATKSVPSGG
jgi:type VII secretion protein EccB